MISKLKDNLASIAALIAAVVAIGGGFVKYGEITTKLNNIEANQGVDFAPIEKQIDELKKEMSKEIKEKYIDTELEMLVEEVKEDGFAYGYTENYLRVKTDKKVEKANTLEKVKVIKLEKELLIGL